MAVQALNQAYRTAEWYAQHMLEQSTSSSSSSPSSISATTPPVVFLTEDPDLRIRSAQEDDGEARNDSGSSGSGRVAVLTMSEYLDQWHPKHVTAQALLDSLILAKEAAAEFAAVELEKAAVRSASGEPLTSTTTRMITDPSTRYVHYLPKATAVAGTDDSCTEIPLDFAKPGVVCIMYAIALSRTLQPLANALLVNCLLIM